MKNEKISISTQSGAINLHAYYPELPEGTTVPGIIILQEAFGVNQNILDICQEFAKQGFLAVAPELFHRAGNDITLDYHDFKKVMPILSTLTNDQLTEDVKTAYEYIQNQKFFKVNQIGSIGFCMGGFTSILAACRLPLQFAIACYGGGISNFRPGIGFEPFMEEFNKIQCPVFLLYGEKDNSIPLEQVEEVRANLKKQEKEYEIKVYLGAGHAFLRKNEPSFQPTSANEAWDDIYNWLKTFR